MNSAKKNGNIILDFSHIYPENIEKEIKGLSRIDLSDISGTDMYCSRRRKQRYAEDWNLTVPAGYIFSTVEITTMSRSFLRRR